MTIISVTAAPARPTRLSILSWALYDLANTVFSMNIVSLYFSLWVVNVMGGSDASYGNAILQGVDDHPRDWPAEFQ